MRELTELETSLLKVLNAALGVNAEQSPLSVVEIEDPLLKRGVHFVLPYDLTSMTAKLLKAANAQLAEKGRESFLQASREMYNQAVEEADAESEKLFVVTRSFAKEHHLQQQTGTVERGGYICACFGFKTN